MRDIYDAHAISITFYYATIFWVVMTNIVSFGKLNGEPASAEESLELVKAFFLIRSKPERDRIVGLVQEVAKRAKNSSVS
jgi:hypothetical protein